MFLEGIALDGESGHSAGRALLARMYAEHIGGTMPPIAVTALGKPYWEGSLWHFSISHTRRHVFCALSRKPIGIDAEEADRAFSPALAKKVLSAMEYAQWETAPDRRLALLTFWVLKEAEAKMTGNGLEIFPNHTNFLLSDPRVRQLQGCLVAVIEEENHVI